MRIVAWRNKGCISHVMVAVIVSILWKWLRLEGKTKEMLGEVVGGRMVCQCWSETLMGYIYRDNSDAQAI